MVLASFRLILLVPRLQEVFATAAGALSSSGNELLARVTFEGRRLAPIRGAAQPTYLLPVNAGQLSITLPPTYRWWRWGQLALLLVVLFLAAPFGSTRPDGSP